MNQSTDNLPNKIVIRNRTRAQATVEFALILPIALLLVFTIIEIARMAQAWLVVTNSARVGLRYAVTGAYDADYCTSDIDVGEIGSICEQEPDKEYRNDEIDAARLLSIYEATEDSAVGITKDLSVTTYGEPGFFDVTVCSTNNEEDDDGNEIIRIYNPPPDEYCSPFDHPGDPSTGPARVIVAVTFEHRVVLPIVDRIAPSVTLHAERTGIVEQFRVARVLGLPPVISVPSATSPPDTFTPTPSETPTPSITPTATDTPLPTFTHTATDTPTLTPTPDCSLYSISGFNMINRYNRIEAWLTNGDIIGTEIEEIELDWGNAEALGDIIIGPNNLHVDWFTWNYSTIWDGRDFSSPTNTSASPTWLGPRDFYAGTTVNFRVDFDFALSNEYDGALTSWGLRPEDFGVTFVLANGCPLGLEAVPRVIPTPTPSCEDIYARNVGLDDDDFQIQVVNDNTAPADLIISYLEWPSNAPGGSYVNNLQFGPELYFDTDTDYSPLTVDEYTDDSTLPAILPQLTRYNWVADFNPGLPFGEYCGVLTFEFEDGLICIIDECDILIAPTATATTDPNATPTPTRTIPPPNTPTWTPTHTSLPTLTLTPSNTPTPSDTPIPPSPTPIPPTSEFPTDTPTEPPTPTNTPWPTQIGG